ncbi:MAG: hypothetical protein HQK82_03015 [Desulfovibrionaceae bacterium]|nr:hypothetical protein [Desulfovibrionaceae bacterium]
MSSKSCDTSLTSDRLACATCLLKDKFNAWTGGQMNLVAAPRSISLEMPSCFIVDGIAGDRLVIIIFLVSLEILGYESQWPFAVGTTNLPLWRDEGLFADQDTRSLTLMVELVEETLGDILFQQGVAEQAMAADRAHPRRRVTSQRNGQKKSCH